MAEGHRSRRVWRRWRDDPEIVARMTRVAEGLKLGKTFTDLAEEENVSAATIRRDAGRLHLLWLEQAGQAIEELRAESIAMLQWAQEEATRRYRETGALRWLQYATSLEQQVVELTGVKAPQRIVIDDEIRLKWQMPTGPSTDPIDPSVEADKAPYEVD